MNITFFDFASTLNQFMVWKNYTLLFKSSTDISNARLKLAKNHANAKENPEAELLLFENYSHSSSTLSSNNNRTYSEK